LACLKIRHIPVWADHKLNIKNLSFNCVLRISVKIEIKFNNYRAVNDLQFFGTDTAKGEVAKTLTLTKEYVS